MIDRIRRVKWWFYGIFVEPLNRFKLNRAMFMFNLKKAFAGLFTDFYYGDPYNNEFGKHLVAFIKEGNYSYIAFYRFDNDKGAILIHNGCFIGSDIILIPINFIFTPYYRCWYFIEDESKKEKWLYMDGGYERVIKKLEDIKKSDGKSVEFDEYKKIKSSDRQYPLKWMQENVSKIR